MRLIRRVETRRIVRPLKTTFATALGSKSSIDNVLVTVVLDDGTCGSGEVPTSFSVPDETVYAIRSVLREAASSIRGLPIDVYPERIQELKGRFSGARMAISGLEVALFRAHLTIRGESEFAYWGGAENHVESDITVPFSSDVNTLRPWLERAISSGFRVFKCKVSGDLTADRHLISMIQSILKTATSDARLRLDGNQGFTESSASAFIDGIENLGVPVELFEQPLPKDDLRGLASLRERVPVPIILDESVFSVESLRRAIDSGACSGVNIKVAKSGISETRRMMEIAQREGVRLMIGCMMETMTGLSAAIHLAGGSKAFDFVDLDSVYFLHHRKRYGDVAVQPPVFSIEQPR